MILELDNANFELVRKVYIRTIHIHKKDFFKFLNIVLSANSPFNLGNIPEEILNYYFFQICKKDYCYVCFQEIPELCAFKIRIPEEHFYVCHCGYKWNSEYGYRGEWDKSSNYDNFKSYRTPGAYANETFSFSYDTLKQAFEEVKRRRKFNER